MSLPNNLVNDFVKSTNKKETNKKETTVYGTLIEEKANGKYYVKLDGASSTIPVSRFTQRVNPNERVIVMIKDHAAIITGNLESPSADDNSVTNIVDKKMENIQSIPTSDIEQLWSDYNKSI